MFLLVCARPVGQVVCITQTLLPLGKTFSPRPVVALSHVMPAFVALRTDASVSFFAISNLPPTQRFAEALEQALTRGLCPASAG